jgi:phospholipase/carboxylesterase
MSALVYRERSASGEPEGLLLLHHGRGTSEQDLLPLADVLDPDRRLLVVAPRAPFQFAGAPGYHWYAVPRVGYPDPETFMTSDRALAALHDELWERTRVTPERTVLGGFSMGTVMSYALGLGPERPVPAGVLAFSGFVPTLDAWEPDLSRAGQTRVFIAHGQNDPVISVNFARRARRLLTDAGFDVDYRESAAQHNIDPPDIGRASKWLDEVIAR